MLKSKAEHIAHARLSEIAQRFAQMLEDVENASKFGESLNKEEQNLLASAFKHNASALRTAWRVIVSVEQKSGSLSDTKIDQITAYRERIESEMEATCLRLISLIDNYLMRTANTVESQVFYLKLQGDYYRYLSEVLSNPLKHNSAILGAKKAYRYASEIGEDLRPTNATKLSLALNYSVFVYEIMNSEKKAMQIAQEAFEEAMDNSSILTNEDHQDSMLFLERLRDNLKLWTAVSMLNPSEEMTA